MLDGLYLQRVIEDALISGLEESLELLANRVRDKAPVRKLFRGGRKRTIAKNHYVGVWHLQATTLAFRHRDLADVMNPAHGSPYEIRAHAGYQVLLSNSGRATVNTTSGPKNQGRANSYIPTTAKMNIGGRMVRLSGSHEVNFRAVNDKEFVHQHVTAKVGSKALNIDISGQYLGRAVSDIKRGVGLHKNAAGETEYGGTLRDSVKTTPITRTEGKLVGYVQAQAIEHGFDYAIAQEFGTMHNRPQPFMRPALREMDSRLTSMTAERLARKLNLAGVSGSGSIRRKSSSIAGPKIGEGGKSVQLSVSLDPSFNTALTRFDTRWKNQGYTNPVGKKK